ncbi:MAG: hypothetical protein CFE43_14670 [Burkholderiales bacterium PBB3]|nr:MAG: hypothetical protein CFE43_14670 [Burkholderiales bacterium PBB3]
MTRFPSSNTAKALASDGAAVVNYASSKAGADAVVNAITSSGGRAVAIQGDVSIAAQAQGLIAAAVAHFGRLDILVNNSGVLAKRLAPRNIRVNVVSPGFVVTEGTTTAGIVGSAMEAGIVSQTPLGRAGQQDDIARVVAFLASNDARFVTGEEITASGGLR